jgi:hypothetical protein
MDRSPRENWHAAKCFLPSLTPSRLPAVAPPNDNICRESTLPFDQLTRADSTAATLQPYEVTTLGNPPGLKQSLWFSFVATSTCVSIESFATIQFVVNLYGVEPGAAFTGPASCTAPQFYDLNRIFGEPLFTVKPAELYFILVYGYTDTGPMDMLLANSTKCAGTVLTLEPLYVSFQVQGTACSKTHTL